METILKFICALRKIFEKKLFGLFAPTGWKDLPDIDKWENLRELPPAKFNEAINKYPYLSDKYCGLLDCSHSIDDPQYFFKDLPYARDCDNWSRIWASYYVYHGKEVQEWVVTNKRHPFTKSHFVAIVKDTKGYRLLNYERYPKVHETPEEALNDLEGWNGGAYNSDVRLQCKYTEFKPEDK